MQSARMQRAAARSCAAVGMGGTGTPSASPGLLSWSSSPPALLPAPASTIASVRSTGTPSAEHRAATADGVKETASKSDAASSTSMGHRIWRAVAGMCIRSTDSARIRSPGRKRTSFGLLAGVAAAEGVSPAAGVDPASATKGGGRMRQRTWPRRRSTMYSLERAVRSRWALCSRAGTGEQRWIASVMERSAAGSAALLNSSHSAGSERSKSAGTRRAASQAGEPRSCREAAASVTKQRDVMGA
mmetsp:Transcript_2528/g.7456  ORF Transcript_2528/g.7456 Transcript_2528/m.7456 type:complete len:244 (+) Transcript_2528:88-819(+)